MSDSELTDEDVAKEWVRHLQLREIAAHGALHLVKKDDIKATLNAGGTKIDLMLKWMFPGTPADEAITLFTTLCDSRRSPHGPDGSIRYILGDLIDYCDAAIAVIGDGRRPLSPAYGFSFEPDLNAKSIGVPFTSSSAIFLNHGFMKFATALSKIVISAMITNTSNTSATGTYEETMIRDTLDSKPGITLQFALVIASYALDGTSARVPYFPGVAGTVPLFQWFLKAIELFVVAHEYAHIYRGHLNITSASSANDNTDSSSLHLTEFQADADAIAIVVQHGLSSANPICRAGVGAIVVLRCSDAIARVADFLGTLAQIVKGFTEHPSADERLLLISHVVKEYNSSLTPDQRGDDAGLRGAVDFVIQELFERALPHFVLMRDTGVDRYLSKFAVTS